MQYINLTSVILTIALELWIALNICYVFRPIEPDFEIKNTKKWTHGGPPRPYFGIFDHKFGFYGSRYMTYVRRYPLLLWDHKKN